MFELKDKSSENLKEKTKSLGSALGTSDQILENTAYQRETDESEVLI